jgi:hypothetical protein
LGRELKEKGERREWGAREELRWRWMERERQGRARGLGEKKIRERVVRVVKI